MEQFDHFLAYFAPSEIKGRNEQRKVAIDVFKNLGIAFFLASTVGVVGLQQNSMPQVKGIQVGMLLVLSFVLWGFSANIAGRIEKES